VRRLTYRWLAEDGYTCRMVGSGAAALEALEGEHSDLMVTDMLMPGMSGSELLRTARTSKPDLAAIMVTGVDDPEIANECLKIGAYGYVVKPLERNEILINVANALERRRLTIESATFQHRLEEQVRARTADIRRREEELCERLVGATEYRDETTGAHVRRIGLYAETLAEALGWNLAGMADIRLAAPMHDVGKIAIPDEFLLKQGSLTSTEFDVVKRHTTIGAEMLTGSRVSTIQMAESIVLSHHER
jgi:putative two-component system response regulator